MTVYDAQGTDLFAGDSVRVTGHGAPFDALVIRLVTPLVDVRPIAQFVGDMTFLRVDDCELLRVAPPPVPDVQHGRRLYANLNGKA